MGIVHAFAVRIGRGAERDVAADLRLVPPEVGLEPDPVEVDEGDERDRDQGPGSRAG